MHLAGAVRGAQAEDFVQHLAADSVPFRATERDIRRTNQLIDYGLHLGSRADVLQRCESFQVNLVQQLTMEACLQLLV